MVTPGQVLAASAVGVVAAAVSYAAFYALRDAHRRLAEYAIAYFVGAEEARLGELPPYLLDDED